VPEVRWFMKPKKIMLVRHGESVGNVDKNIYATVPDYALGLSERGRGQALEAGRVIKRMIGDERVMVYLSSYQRTRMTAVLIREAIAPQVYKWYEDDRLREQEWGHFREREATKELEKERVRYGTFFYRFPDGESCADVCDRISSFLTTMHRDFEKEDFPPNVLIVTHGMTMRCFVKRWFHMDRDVFELIRNPANCGVYVMEMQGEGKYKLVTELDMRERKEDE
jgi:broad specificity phosphatase PhoE